MNQFTVNSLRFTVKRKSRIFYRLPFTVYCLLIVLLSGCSPTYPKERFEKSIAKLCKDEYKLDVRVQAIGKTIAIYVPLSDLLDFTFAITKQASEKINDVILSVSRVTLSTDADFNFYCIIAHDVRIPEIQIVIIKSVDDVKRFLLNDISRGEYSKRMLVDMRLNPQAQKERAIKDVFDKMKVDHEWQERVLSDFFRSEPTVLGDIGYWNSRFYIKDISLAEFLAEEIASRVRIEFKDDKDLADAFLIKSSKGLYVSAEGKRYFKVEVLAIPQRLKEFENGKVSDKVFEEIMTVASHVLRGYKFEDFDRVEMTELSGGRMLSVSREDLEAFRTKKIKFEEIVTRS